MKKLLTLTVAVAVFTLVGCAGKTTTTVPTAAGTFELTTPQSVSIDQGESKEITISIDRKGFNDVVNLSIDGLPTGVQAPPNMTIAAGQNEVKGMLTAAPDATVSEDHVAKIRASAAGTEKVVDFKITVNEKK